MVGEHEQIRRTAAQLERLENIRRNRRSIEQAFFSFHKLNVFSSRLDNKDLFSPDLSLRWEIYVREITLALNQLEKHEKQFLEDCFYKRKTYKDMFLSKSSYYRCLSQYSKKFLSLFDFDLFHITMSGIYSSITEDRLKFSSNTLS